MVFDLGGVLVELSGVDEMRELAGMASVDEVWARWLSCEWVRRYERGRCSTEEFGQGVVDDWGLELAPDEFVERFRRWPTGLLDGAAELVAAVRDRVPTACLSNTNALHWQEQGTKWGLAGWFDHIFLSHDLGLIKPDREVFDLVAEALATAPERIAFVDDNQINVDGARLAGFDAHLAIGPANARAALTALGVFGP